MSRKEYTDTPEQFREWLRENGLKDPLTGKPIANSKIVDFDIDKISDAIKPLVISFNDFEVKLSLLRPKIEELAKLIQCPQCYDFKKVNEELCEWCRKPE